MSDRVSVAGSPVSDTPAERRSAATRTSGGVAARLLGQQGPAGNAAVQRMAPELGRLLAPARRAVHRCAAGGCTCGGGCGRHDDEFDEELRTGAAALQRAVADRRMIARDQDPGPPEPAEMKGMTCGFKSDGTPFCTVYTGKGELEVDPKSLSPQDRQAAFDPKRPKDCPPERWNWLWQKCCSKGERFDLSQRHCAPEGTRKEQPSDVPAIPIRPFELPSTPPKPIDIPPPSAKDPGDFPLPEGDQAYA